MKIHGALCLGVVIAVLSACGGGSTATQSAAATQPAAATAAPTPQHRSEPTLAQRREAARRAAAARKAAAQEAAAAKHAEAQRVADEKRQARIPMHEYWVAAAGALDKATSSAHDAASAISNGDTVAASAGFSNCASDANAAMMASTDNVPDGWSDVSEQLGLAASTLEDACKSAVAALDDEKPSELATVQSKMAEFRQYQTMAALKAVSLFVQAGGDARNL